MLRSAKILRFPNAPFIIFIEIKVLLLPRKWAMRYLNKATKDFYFILIAFAGSESWFRILKWAAECRGLR